MLIPSLLILLLIVTVGAVVLARSLAVRERHYEALFASIAAFGLFGLEMGMFYFNLAAKERPPGGADSRLWESILYVLPAIAILWGWGYGVRYARWLQWGPLGMLLLCLISGIYGGVFLFALPAALWTWLIRKA